jgi:hypothetical protein
MKLTMAGRQGRDDRRDCQPLGVGDRDFRVLGTRLHDLCFKLDESSPEAV